MKLTKSILIFSASFFAACGGGGGGDIGGTATTYMRQSRSSQIAILKTNSEMQSASCTE